MTTDEGAVGGAAISAFNGTLRLQGLLVQTPVKELQEETVTNRLQKTAVTLVDAK